MNPSLTTDRLLIRTGEESLAETLLCFYEENKKEFEPYDPVLSRNFYTKEYQRKAILYEQKEIKNGRSMHYYVFLKEHPETLIGNIEFDRILPNPFYSTVLSYRFHHEYWHCGYATESINAAIASMFSEYEIHRMEARVTPDNTPSIRLLERLGFRFEGTEYESVKINGIFKDHLRYSLLQGQSGPVHFNSSAPHSTEINVS